MQEKKPAGGGHGPIAVTLDDVVMEPVHAIEIIRIPTASGGPPPPLILVGEDLGPGGNEQDASTGDRQPGGEAADVFGRRRATRPGSPAST